MPICTWAAPRMATFASGMAWATSASTNSSKPTKATRCARWPSVAIPSTWSLAEKTRWCDCGNFQPVVVYSATLAQAPRANRHTERRQCSTTPKTTSCFPTKRLRAYAAGTPEMQHEGSCYPWGTIMWSARLCTRPWDRRFWAAAMISELVFGTSALSKIRQNPPFLLRSLTLYRAAPLDKLWRSIRRK